jgi:transposase
MIQLIFFLNVDSLNLFSCKKYLIMRLKKEDKEALRKRINLIFVNNPGMQTSEIVHQLEKEGYARRTVYNALDRRKKGQPIFDKKRSGRPSTWTSSMKATLHRLVNNRKGVSQRKLARKFGKNESTIGRQIKKMKINNFAREKTPKYSEKQALKAKKLSRKLVNQLYESNLHVIMDDEKYFTFDGDNMPGNDRYYT